MAIKTSSNPPGWRNQEIRQRWCSVTASCLVPKQVQWGHSRHPTLGFEACQVMVMFKFNCQAKAIASVLIYLDQGSNRIDLVVHLFFQRFAVRQALYYPYTVLFLVDWHMF